MRGGAYGDVSGDDGKVRCDMEQKMLDRATYKKIKGMTREEMQNFLTNYSHNVMEDAEAPTLDLSDLKKELSSIKGVGEKRLNDIMSIIEKYLR
mgnify:CR=1 FL=1